MVKYAETNGIYTNLTTNGTLIEKNIDKIFSSGLREIAFGIYNKRNLTTVLPQINALIRERDKRNYIMPKIYMDITIYKRNLNQILDLVELAFEQGMDAVILHRIFNVYNPDLKYISVEEEKELFLKVKKLARKKRLKVYLPTKHSFPCKVVKNSIFVDVEGNVTPCCFLPQSYMGNALFESMDKIMNSKIYTDFIKTMHKHPVCSRCQW